MEGVPRSHSVGGLTPKTSVRGLSVRKEHREFRTLRPRPVAVLATTAVMRNEPCARSVTIITHCVVANMMETGRRVLGAERQRSTQDPKAKGSDVTATARNGRPCSVTRFLSYLPRSHSQSSQSHIFIQPGRRKKAQGGATRALTSLPPPGRGATRTRRKRRGRFNIHTTR